MNIQEIIQEQRTSEAYGEAIEMIMGRLARSEDQIKQIEEYIKDNQQALINEYAVMIQDAQANDTAIAFYDIWTIAKADEALFG